MRQAISAAIRGHPACIPKLQRARLLLGLGLGLGFGFGFGFGLGRVYPSCSAFSSDMMRHADAPSVRKEALAAVTEP